MSKQRKLTDKGQWGSCTEKLKWREEVGERSERDRTVWRNSSMVVFWTLTVVQFLLAPFFTVP